jgi:hypothetical protein
LEALFRLGVQRVDYFREPWNVFDFVVVLLSIAGMLLKTVALCSIASYLFIYQLFDIERLHSFFRDQLNKSHGGHVGVPDKRF